MYYIYYIIFLFKTDWWLATGDRKKFRGSRITDSYNSYFDQKFEKLSATSLKPFDTWKKKLQILIADNFDKIRIEQSTEKRDNKIHFWKFYVYFC